MTNDLTPRITDDEVSALPIGAARADLLRELLNHTGNAQAPKRPRSRPPWLAPVAAAAAVLAVATPIAVTHLANGRNDVSGSATTTRTVEFQIRQVRASSNNSRQATHRQQLRFTSTACPDPSEPAAADESQLACDATGAKYLLDPAALENGFDAAHAVQPTYSVSWSVTLDLDGSASQTYAQLTKRLTGSDTQIAFVVDGTVIRAATVNAPIDNGQLELATGLSEANAHELANRLGN